MIYGFHYDQTPVGRLYIAADEYALKAVSFQDNPKYSGMAVEKKTPLIHQAYKQLCEFFDGKRKEFTLPLAPEGTDFQKRVWQALGHIPYGETRSYKQIAAEAGSPRGYRAVGLANNRNPIAIIIPCHRVIGCNGSMTGYAGGLKIKEMLLKLEKENV